MTETSLEFYMKKLSDYLDVEVNYLTDIGSGFSINSESVFALTIEHIRDGAFKYKKKVYDFDSAETHEIITNIEKHLLEQLKNIGGDTFENYSTLEAHLYHTFSTLMISLSALLKNSITSEDDNLIPDAAHMVMSYIKQLKDPDSEIYNTYKNNLEIRWN